MYCLTVNRGADAQTFRSGEIARMVAENRDGHPDVMRHLSAIESLEARGCRYSNQDYDVLAAAYDFATEPRAGHVDSTTAGWDVVTA